MVEINDLKSNKLEKIIIVFITIIVSIFVLAFQMIVSCPHDEQTYTAALCDDYLIKAGSTIDFDNDNMTVVALQDLDYTGGQFEVDDFDLKRIIITFEGDANLYTTYEIFAWWQNKMFKLTYDGIASFEGSDWDGFTNYLEGYGYWTDDLAVVEFVPNSEIILSFTNGQKIPVPDNGDLYNIVQNDTIYQMNNLQPDVFYTCNYCWGNTTFDIQFLWTFFLGFVTMTHSLVSIFIAARKFMKSNSKNNLPDFIKDVEEIVETKEE